MIDASKIDRAAYEERLTTALMEAVMFGSIVEVDGQKSAIVVSDIAAKVLIVQLAVILAGSAECASPSGTRKTCEQIAHKLRRYINETKQHGSPFDRRITMEAPNA